MIRRRTIRVAMLFLGTLRARDVVVLRPRGTAKLAARYGTLTGDEVTAIRNGLARRLPAA